MNIDDLNVLMKFTELVLKNKSILQRVEMPSYQNVFLKGEPVLTFWSDYRSVFTTSICHENCVDFISDQVWLYATSEFITLLEFSSTEELMFQYSLIAKEDYVPGLVLLSFYMKLCKENDCSAISSHLFENFDLDEAKRVLRENNVQY